MPSIELPRTSGGKVVVRYDAPRQRWSIQVYNKDRTTEVSKTDLTGTDLAPLVSEHADMTHPKSKKVHRCAQMGLDPSLLGVS